MGPHHLRRFLRYASKVYDLKELVRSYDDFRQHPRVLPAQVFLAAFWLWLFQWRSFHQLERRMREATWRYAQLLPGRTGSVDTVGRALTRADLSALRRGVQQVVRCAQRGKVWHPGSVGRWRVITLDGTELWATRRRHCSECQVRMVGAVGSREREYYHRVVACQVVGRAPRMLLDVEPIGPGEGEEDAGRRALTRVLEAHGRWIDLVVVDAEYAAAPWLNRWVGRVWVLVRVKDARMHLIQDVEGLWAGEAPVTRWRRANGEMVEAWEAYDVESWEGVKVPLRVVRFREPSPDGVVRDHLFATTCPREVSLPDLWRCAHARWDIENTAFHDLKHYWHASHCYVHHPIAIEALLLIGMLAVNLFWAYVYRQLVPREGRVTVLGVIEALVADYYRLSAPLRRDTPLWDSS